MSPFTSCRRPSASYSHLYIQGRPQPLHHTAAHLLVDELRVDEGAAVLDAPVLEQRHLAGFHVDLDVAGLDAVGEGERPRRGT